MLWTLAESEGWGLRGGAIEERRGPDKSNNQKWQSDHFNIITLSIWRLFHILAQFSFITQKQNKIIIKVLPNNFPNYLKLRILGN